MSISELEADEVACWENPRMATVGCLNIQPPGWKHRISISNIPSRGTLTWNKTSKSHIAGVEGFYFILAAAEKSPSGINDDAAEDTSYFLRTVLFLDATGHKRDAADLAIDKLDDLLNEGDFYKCNSILRTAIPGDMSDLLIVTFLGITLGAKGSLASRSAFYSRAVAAVSERRGVDEADKLLNKYR